MAKKNATMISKTSNIFLHLNFFFDFFIIINIFETNYRIFFVQALVWDKMHYQCRVAQNNKMSTNIVRTPMKKA